MNSHSPGISPRQYQQLIAFMDAACRVIPERFPPNACIACTRVTLEVLTRWHFRVRPCSVEAQIANPALVARWHRLRRKPRSHDELEQWTHEDGSYLIHLGGGGPRADHWAGHLVALVEGRVMVDLSLPQANTPERGITLTSLICDVPRGFGKGQLPHTFEMGGCRVEYRAFPEKIGYQTAIDWSDRHRHADTIETIHQIMKEQLAPVEAEVLAG